MAADNTWPFVLYFIALIVILLIYVFVVCALLVNRHTAPFNSSFFTIWTHLGINDCVYLITMRVFSYNITGVDWLQLPVLKNKKIKLWVGYAKH
jgi:hypothetical protein